MNMPCKPGLRKDIPAFYQTMVKILNYNYWKINTIQPFEIH